MSEYFRKHIKKQHYPTHPSSIKFWTQFKNCVLDSLRNREWKEVGHDGDWDICWVEKEAVHEIFDKTHLTTNQKINHFRNHYEITRKDLMIKNLKRHKRNLEKGGKIEEAASYDFFPTTYNLPNEYSIFSDEFKKNNHTIWIMKPIGKSQGKGIFLFKKLSQIAEWKNDSSSQAENYIVQKYVSNPLLIGGKKFDLRIYCLVTSYSPLTAYLYRDGFARFTHHRYDNNDISNTYVHLTNVAIQKHSENYDRNLGGKWDLRTLKLYLASKYGHEKVAECFLNIQQIIIKTLQCVQRVIINDKHCFELYGFDILINSNLKPWVLEVNGSPSMTANTQHDRELKCGLLDDTFSIIDMEKILTGQEEQIGGFDLICRGNPIKNGNFLNPSMLGCLNNRIQQLQKYSKITSARLAQAYSQAKETSKTDQRKNNSKESLQTAYFNTTIDYDLNSKKLRSKSIGKMHRSSILGPAAVKISHSILKPKQSIEVLPKESREIRISREGRESRDSCTSLEQYRPRLYKGKTIELPPVNSNSFVSSSQIGVSINQANQSYINQNTAGNSTEAVVNTISNTITSRISTSQSHAPASETNSKQISSKLFHPNNLPVSLSAFINRNSGQQSMVYSFSGNNSFLQPSDGLGSLRKMEKNTPSKKNQNNNVRSHILNRSASPDRRLRIEAQSNSEFEKNFDIEIQFEKVKKEEKIPSEKKYLDLQKYGSVQNDCDKEGETNQNYLGENNE